MRCCQQCVVRYYRNVMRVMAAGKVQALLKAAQLGEPGGCPCRTGGSTFWWTVPPTPKDAAYLRQSLSARRGGPP